MQTPNSTPIPVQDPKAELDQLAQQLETVKTKIKDSRDRQALIEERITALVGVKEEGTISQKTSQWRISTTGGLTRALELHDPEWYRVRLGSSRFDELVIIKLSIRTAEFRRASQEEQAILMENMLTKPRRVTVRIEPREEA